ncbi:MAG: hypothetical protein Q6373_020265 [Candidatus Sigynarchaeota archaeon]
MLKGLWLRLDVPYSKDANKMRAVLAYSEPGKEDNAKLLTAADCKNIPEAVQSVLEQAKSSNIEIDSNLTLVYPLDDRHGLAGHARDEADKKQFKFSRHVPDAMKMPVDLETGYENFDTGSTEDTYDFDQARAAILQLNQEANDSFNSNDLLEAMGPLRHALWLALRHLGWRHPGTAYTLRNLGYTLISTGNSENAMEIEALLLKMIYLWECKAPNKDIWKGSEHLLDELASLCVALKEEELGAMLLNHKTELLKG